MFRATVIIIDGIYWKQPMYFGDICSPKIVDICRHSSRKLQILAKLLPLHFHDRVPIPLQSFCLREGIVKVTPISLQKGDLLLKVNEASLDGLTHSQAVATLKATISLSSVSLTIMEVRTLNRAGNEQSGRLPGPSLLQL